MVPSDDPAPFGLLLSKTPNKVTYGNLGPGVKLGGGASFVSTTGFSGSDPNVEVSASWGKGVEPVSFPVTVVPEPATGLMAAFGLLGLLGIRRRR